MHSVGSTLLAALMLSSPTATTCDHPPVPARMIGAQLPSERLNRPYATVLASVDTNGTVTDVHVLESTGSPKADTAQLEAVRRWTFLPAEVQCHAVAGTSEFAVGFAFDQTFPDPLNHDALVTMAMQPMFPPSAQVYGRATVFVGVDVDQRGGVVRVRIDKSSGNMPLDQAALSAARESTYAPRVNNGVPQPATYLFRADFQSFYFHRHRRRA